MEKKLTINQLKNYLGTGLKVLDYSGSIELLQSVFLIHDIEDGKGKPFFFRLSDLDKFIPELGFVPLIELAKIDLTIKNVDFEINKFGNCVGRLNAGVTVVFEIQDEIPFIKEVHNNIFDQVSGNDFHDMYLSEITPSQIREKLFQWHFWVFGDEYFELGLVIDKLAKKPDPK